MLQPLLSRHTAPLVHSIISTIVDQCSEEAQSLVFFHHTREHNRLWASASSSCTSSQETTPATDPISFNMEEEAGMSQISLQGSRSCLQPVPDPAEWDQPQEEPEQAAVAGLSAGAASAVPPFMARAGTTLSGIPRVLKRGEPPDPRILFSPPRGRSAGARLQKPSSQEKIYSLSVIKSLGSAFSPFKCLCVTPTLQHRLRVPGAPGPFRQCLLTQEILLQL